MAWRSGRVKSTERPFRVLRLALPFLAVVLAAAGWASAGFIAYQVPAGTNGNQAHGGPLGMDLDLSKMIIITSLGVFDDGSNGLTRTLNVRLYDRTDTSSPLASLTFTPEDPGELIGGSRFKDLPSPLSFMPGFQGTIVADGYGTGEQNGNGMGSGVSWTTDGAGGVIAFVGASRWGMTAGTYPTNLDSGPANRYAAGTFEYNLPEPATVTLLGLGAAGLLSRRRRNAR